MMIDARYKIKVTDLDEEVVMVLDTKVSGLSRRLDTIQFRCEVEGIPLERQIRRIYRDDDGLMVRDMCGVVTENLDRAVSDLRSGGWVEILED